MIAFFCCMVNAEYSLSFSERANMTKKQNINPYNAIKKLVLVFFLA